jgi:hypothetical protein
VMKQEMLSPGEGVDVDAFCLLSLDYGGKEARQSAVQCCWTVWVVVVVVSKVSSNVVWLNLKCSDAEKPHDLGIHSCLVSVEDFV